MNREQRYFQDLTATKRRKPLEVAAMVCACLVAIAVVAMVAIREKGQFGWRQNPQLEFRWHPLLATIGFIFLFGLSIIIYRINRIRKKILMVVHASLHTAALVCIIVSLVAAFDFHNYSTPKLPNFLSLHSWIGIMAVAIFTIQWAVGILTMHPGVPPGLQNKMLPYHTYFGMVSFFCSITSAILSNGKVHSGGGLTNKELEGNVTGLLIFIYAMLILFIIMQPR